LIAVTVGGVTKVNRSDEAVAEIPPAVVTVMSTVPALPGGAVAVIEVAESAVMAPNDDPKLTEVEPKRFVPETVTDVPPAVGPLFGITPVTAGAGT
jgi:hypothetical protein